jgi:hypothetical protein
MFRKFFIKVKTGIIFGILLLSLFITFNPTISAGIINVDPIINVTYPVQEEEIIPNSGVLDIPLFTTFRLIGPFARFVERFSLLGDVVLQIELKIVDMPDWCEASISDPLVKLPLDHTEPYQSSLTVTVNENAPAYTQGVVKIRATSKIQRGLIFNIDEQSVEFEVSFIIGYWSVVSYALPEGNIAEIEPFETADFHIEIENLGNGPTKVSIELVDITEEKWDINIVSNIILGSPAFGESGTSKTVHLKIKPKINSNWKNKIETFKVKFKSSYLGRPYLLGSEEIIQFNVRKIGSLKEEEETGNNLLIILIVTVVIIIFLSIFLKRKYS